MEDLKGRKVALYAKGIIQDYLTGKMAEEVGLTIRDFDCTHSSAPIQLAAFETEGIDAAQTAEPRGCPAGEAGAGPVGPHGGPIQGPRASPEGPVMCSGAFSKDRRPTAQRWMDDYVRGCGLHAAGGVQEPEDVAIVEKDARVAAKAIRRAAPFYLDPSGRVSLQSLADQIQCFAANGYIPHAIPVDQAVDLSFLK